MREGFGMNHCLCHGDLGNYEFVAKAVRDLELGGVHLQAGEPSLGDQCDSLVARILESVRSDWHTGVPGGLESPGLMTGIAGIGYGLLRMAAPEQVPSVLLLEPPLRNTRPAAHSATRPTGLPRE